MSQPVEGGVKKYHVDLSIVARVDLPNFKMCYQALQKLTHDYKQMAEKRGLRV